MDRRDPAIDHGADFEAGYEVPSEWAEDWAKPGGGGEGWEP